MKVGIVVFSPSGNTLKVATMLQEELINHENEVQLLDITRNQKVFKTDGLQDFLVNHLKEHDVLCIGGPVYAHHLHYNVKRIIQSLPKTGDRWSRPAIPFVTYGTISSGIALHEAAVLLEKSGRITVYGMKVAAFHCMSRLLSIPVGQGLPDKRSLPVIAELAERIDSLPKMNGDELRDITPVLDYQTLLGRMKAKLIFRERFWHRHIYPKLEMNRSLCILCGQCVKVCPVQHWELARNIVAADKRTDCIHCGECIHVCPTQAISFQCDLQKWEKLFAEAAKGNGPMPSHESPKSAVYPLRRIDQPGC
jgi:ferredoxin